MTNVNQILLLGLSLCLWACPDDVSPGDGKAGTEGGSINIAGDLVSGMESGESMGATMSGETCFDDSSCPDGTYCEFGDSFEGTCEEGCQENGCDGGRLCDLTTRECVFPPCEADAECPEGTYCNDSVCETGCRVDDACPDGFDEDGRAILCDPLTRECVSHSPCCVSAGGEESCVAATADQCDALSGQLIQNSLLCDDNPCGQTCEVDVDCRELDVNGATYYCDPVDNRCREGCREGECDGDLVCDPVSRLCTNQSCTNDDDCGEGQFCNPVDLVCVSGCGDDSDCEGGFSCINNLCVESCDPSNDTCGEGRYCDETSNICRNLCATHNDCLESEACDPTTFQCQAGACRDDEALGELSGEPNSTFEEASRLNLVPLATNPEYSSGQAEGRIICGADLDLYRVSLSQGERMRITLSHDGGADLNIRIFSANDTSNVLAQANTLEIPEVIEYPPEGDIQEAQDYFIEVGGALDEDARVTYTLSLQTAPLGNACFFDNREADAGDNDKDNATSLIPNSISRYDDGTICVGDEDWFSLPLTVNDGLSVELRTAIVAQALRVELYSGSSLNSISGNPTPAFAADFDSSMEDASLGDRIYQFAVPFNSAGFEDDTWYLKIVGDEADNYANYRLTVDHEASANVCMADTFEPNDSVGASTDIVTTLMLPIDDNGFLAQGQDNRVQNATLCSGDVDYYCFELADGDRIEAWVISDDTIGSLTVSFVDSEGGSVGTDGRHTLTGEDFDKARFSGAPLGRYCAVVDGLANAQGSYELNIRRTIIEGGICGEDELEGRNDLAGNADALEDISGGQSLRFEKVNGVMCGTGDPADWYTFSVATDRSSICAMLEGFNHDDVAGGLDVELYEAPNLNTTSCGSDNDCMDGACISGHCQVPSRSSNFIYDFEMLSLPKYNVSAGEHYLRVLKDGIATTIPYDLRVTVTPERDVCQPDWQEVGDPNDNSRSNGYDPSRATVLGSGSVGLCDTWICDRGNGNYDEDWYQVTVPAQEDRTIIINYSSQSDGPLELYYYGETLTSMQSDVIMGSTTGSPNNYQCINVSAGSVENIVEFGVGSLRDFTDDGDMRIDYSLRIVPTDLSINPDGECGRFGANSFSACAADDPGQMDFAFAEQCWPTVYLP